MDLFALSQAELDAARERIWRRVQSRLDERAFQPHYQAFREADIEPSRLKQVQLKERLLDALPERETFGFWRRHRKAFATSGLFAFFAFIFTPIFSIPVTSAKENVLIVESGQVFLNGDFLPVGTQVPIEVGDKIETYEDSLAHVQFINHGRVTLDSDTKLTLKSVQAGPVNPKDMDIILDQEDGRIWVQIDSSNASSLVVEVPEGKVTAKQSTTFDVEVDEEVAVKVVKNVVSVENSGGEKDVIAQGKQVSMQEGLQVDDIAEEDLNDSWTNYNESYGVEYVASLKSDREGKVLASVKVSPDSPLYGLKTFREDLQSYFALTDGSQRELLMKKALGRLLDAGTLLVQGKDEEAQVYLDEFMALAKELEGSEEFLAVLYEQELGLPVLEQTVNEAMSGFLDDPKELNDHLIGSASFHLYEAMEAIEQGNLGLAQEHLASYQSGASGVFDHWKSLSLDERTALAEEYLDQKLSDYEMLQLIQSSPGLEDAVNANEQILFELHEATLVLQEDSLGHVEDLLELADEDALDLDELPNEIIQEFEAVTQEISALEEEMNAGSVEVDVKTAATSDISHTDETNDETNGSEDATDDPEPHDDL